VILIADFGPKVFGLHLIHNPTGPLPVKPLGARSIGCLDALEPSGTRLK
jgi:hypothetical protein